MSIKNNLIDMLKDAMRSSDSARKNVIRGLRAKVEQELLAQGRPRDADDDLTYLKCISSFKTALEKAVVMLERGGRGDSELAESYRYEIAFCEGLMPPRKSSEEVIEIVRQVIQETGVSGAKDAGKVIKAVMAKYAGQVDGGDVARAVKDML